jgi:hypothetical protein
MNQVLFLLTFSLKAAIDDRMISPTVGSVVLQSGNFSPTEETSIFALPLRSDLYAE